MNSTCKWLRVMLYSILDSARQRQRISYMYISAKTLLQCVEVAHDVI
jgi:hypothetical protein